MSVSWEVRRGLEEWELEMHIVKELRALNTFFNNMLLSLKSGLLILAQLPRRSKRRSYNMVLFPLQLMTLRSYMTNHITMMTSWNKFRSIQSLRLRSKRRVWLNSLSFHLLFLLCEGMYTDLPLEVELLMGTKSGTTT